MAPRRSLAWLCLGLAVSAATVQAQPSQLETAVKATYLYKLAPFVEWPEAGRQGNFVICIIGADPFGPVLDRAVAGQAYDTRPITVARLAVMSSDATCHIAYLGGTPSQVTAGLRAAEGRPVLTVTDGGKPAGMIDFAVQQGKVRFHIDQAAAETSNLTISPKLLSLALSVRSKGQP